MDRESLDRLSSVLLVLGGILVVGSIIVASRAYGTFPTRDNPGFWIYFAVGLTGAVAAYGGLILDQYLKTGSLRQAVINWAVGFAVVLVVVIGGYLLRR